LKQEDLGEAKYWPLDSQSRCTMESYSLWCYYCKHSSSQIEL